MFILHFNSFFEVFAGDMLEPPWHQAGRTLGWSFCGTAVTAHFWPPLHWEMDLQPCGDGKRAARITAS